MLTIDAQVHAYERDRPERPWAGVLAGPDEVTGDQMIAAMDKAGVDAAILISPLTMYKYDASYALEVYKTHGDRFGLIKPVDPTDPKVAEIVTDWKNTPGTVGVRMLLVRGGLPVDPADPGLNAVLKTAAKLDFPVNLHIAGRLDQGIELIRRNPDVQIIVDHLGLVQPMHPPKYEKPWSDLDQVVTVAKFPNVAMKITGACVLSQQPYPYPDIWGPVCRLIDAFGIDRCMWGTDWTRATDFLTYEQGVTPFLETDKVSASDKVKLMAGTLMNVYRWKPKRGRGGIKLPA